MNTLKVGAMCLVITVMLTLLLLMPLFDKAQWLIVLCFMVQGDRLADLDLGRTVVRLNAPASLTRRIHVSGHAHERYFCRDSHSLPITWVGAALHRGANSALRDPLLVTLHYK